MPEKRKTLDAMAEEIFELYKLVALLRSRESSGAEELSETEYLTLDCLAKSQPLTIGEVQRKIGVVPAQMSRIVRALEENGGRGLLRSQINPKDRRCVDIFLTETGRAAHAKFRAARLGSMHQTLAVLTPDDRESFMRIVSQLQAAFAERVAVSSDN